MGKIEDIIEYMEKEEIDLAFICETWMKASQSRPHECVVHMTSYPTTTVGRRANYGVAVILNPKYIENGKKHEENELIYHDGSPGLTAYFTFKGISFGGVYLPHDWPDEKIIELLTFPIGAGPTRVLLGDFNMRLGALTGDHNTNKRGDTLYPILEEEGWCLCRASDNRPTFFEASTRRSSIVDYFWTDCKSRELWKRTYTAQDFHSSSDHCMVVSEFGMPPARDTVMAEAVQYKRWNYRKLEEEVYREIYTETLRKYLAECNELHQQLVAEKENGNLSDQELVDRLEEAITLALTRTAETTIGEVTVRIKKGRLMDETLRKMKKYKNEMPRRARKANDHDHVLAEELWRQYRQARDLEGKYLKKIVKNAYERFSREVHAKSKTESAKILRNIKSSRQRGKSSYLRNDETNMEEYRKHFEEQFTRKEWQGTPRGVELETVPTDPDPEPFPIVIIEKPLRTAQMVRPQDKAGFA
jgi:hypothetical protein